MAEANTYLNSRFKGERLDDYETRGYFPVYLGDVLGDRYQVFRKLGTGSQCTVWLARDRNVSTRLFRVLKIYDPKSSEKMRTLVDSLKHISHPGEKHVEVPFDSFTIQGPKGTHLFSLAQEEKPQEETPQEEGVSDRAEVSASTEPESENVSDSDSSSDSDDDDDNDKSPPQWKLDFDECERRIAEYWAACEPGDATAEPLSDAWNKANFFNSRDSIELPQRRDGKPLGPDEIQYTVEGSPLATGFDLGDVINPDKCRTFRVVLTDLGFSCPFEERGKNPMPPAIDYMAPEGLLGLPDVPASDIYSLGLWFWEVVMLRGFVVDAGYPQPKDRVLQCLARRLGPVPASLRAHWPDADQFLDAEGNSLETPEQDEDEYDDDFPRGDVWHQGRNRKPLDMSEEDLAGFVHLIQKMLRWEPENRPSTEELLQDSWLNNSS
ncbi:protein kinase domain protein [Apiospora arundinis]